MSITINWTSNPQYDEFVKDCLLKGYSKAATSRIFNEKFNLDITPNALNKRIYRNKEYFALKGVDVQPKGILQKAFDQTQDDIQEGLTNVDTKSDGSVNLQGLLKLKVDQLADNDYLLEMFGYDKDVWEVVSSSSTVWDGAIKGGKQKMYRCKITVKRKVVPISVVGLTDIVGKTKQLDKVDLSGKYVERDWVNPYLVLPIYDKHMGINTFEHYEKEQRNIRETIKFTRPKHCVISLGGDIFHNDSIVHGTTTKGTLIDKVDMVKAIEDFIKYFDGLMETALKFSKKVTVISVAGNHDTTIGYLVAQMLRVKWEKSDRAVFDVDFGYRKAILLGDVMIGFAHGDKARKNIAQLFANEFPEMWGKSKYREIVVGHLHSGKAERPIYEDVGGATVRQMASSGSLDEYHVFNGYTMATAMAQTMTYSDRGLLRMDYYPL